MNQDGVVDESSFTKFNIKANNEIKISNKLKINSILNFNRNITDAILTSNRINERAGPISAVLQYDPTISANLGLDGRYVLNPTLTIDNPLALINGMNQQRKNNRFFGILTTNYEIVDGLTATLRLGADVSSSREDMFNSNVTQAGLSAGGIAGIKTNEFNHWITELFVNYKKENNKNNLLSILGGTVFEEFNQRFSNSEARDFPSDLSGTNLLGSGDPEQNKVLSGRLKNSLNSFIGRINYTLFNKYLLTGSVRVDGSSRFAEENQYAVFPSISAGWKVSDESFFPKNKFLTSLKLRLGYGQLGNQAINNFATQQNFISNAPIIVNVNGLGTVTPVLGGSQLQGLVPARIANSDLKWETTEEYNVGLDFSLFKSRINGSIEYYVRETKDQLLEQPLTSTSGFQSKLVNSGIVRNKGFELFVKSTNINNDNFKWETSLNLSTLKNEVIELPGTAPIIGGLIGDFTKNFLITREGDALWSFYGYIIDDIDNDTGEPVFRDVNNDGTIDDDDRTILGNPFPDLILGLNNSFSYKNWGLDIFLTSVSGIEVFDNNLREALQPTSFLRNRLAEPTLGRWTPNNTDATYPSGINPGSYLSGRGVNSLTVRDASFIRLKTVTLSYQIPSDKLKFAKSLTFSIGIDNLFTSTDFLGYDPDANAAVNDNKSVGGDVSRVSYNSYPLNKNYRFGLKINF